MKVAMLRVVYVVAAATAVFCQVQASESSFKPSIQTNGRKIGDGFNVPFKPSSPERVVSTSYMNFYTAEDRDGKPEAEDDTEFYYKPIKSDPLLDDPVSIVKLDTKSKVAYSHKKDDQDSISNTIDIQNVPQKNYGIVKKTTFTAVFKHLFEIIQDVLNIMRQMYYPDPSEKSDDGSFPDTWPLLKSVFLRYLRLVKETDLLRDLRDIIPIDDLEIAVETEDGDLITKAIIKSLNPSMFSFICDTLKDLIMPLAHLTDNIAVPELREYMPSTPSIDITWPIRFLVRRGLGIVGYLFSRRELNTVWQEFRSYSPFTARSLEYVLPLEEEEPDYNTVSILSEDDASEGRLLSNPYFLLAGFGSTVMATVVAYTFYGNSNENKSSSRQKRSVTEPISPLMESSSNIANLIKILESVNPDSDEITRLTEGIKETKPKKSYMKKFDPLRKLVNYASQKANRHGPKKSKYQ